MKLKLPTTKVLPIVTLFFDAAIKVGNDEETGTVEFAACFVA